MIEIKHIDIEKFREIADGAGVDLPIEQSDNWAKFESTITDRKFWDSLVIYRDGTLIAIMSLFDYLTHGYHYLRSHHGPVYLVELSKELESEVIDALISYIKSADKNIAFARFGIKYESNKTHYVLSGAPYDKTVIVDLCNGDEETILSKFKSRGRRDVRKSLRECTAEISDETLLAIEDFTPYYEVMIDTCKRDGFAPPPMSDYSNMLGTLGHENARLFAARDSEGLCSWTIATISGSVATRYYAALSTRAMRSHVVDKEILKECVLLYEAGCKRYDMMAIGSDFSPSLMGLNTFKCKFSNDVVDVIPDRDIALKPAFYKALSLLKKIKG